MSTDRTTTDSELDETTSDGADAGRNQETHRLGRRRRSGLRVEGGSGWTNGGVGDFECGMVNPSCG
jgi:hypothetical protein